MRLPAFAPVVTMPLITIAPDCALVVRKATVAVFNQAMTDFEDLRNKTYNGGSISVGVVNNVYKLK